MSIWGAAISIVGGAIVGGISNSRSRRSNQSAQREADRRDLLNALENEALQGQNASIIRSVGGMNAAQILEVGQMNSDFIIAARDRNVDLMRIEQTEELRRHINDEVDSAGLIRVGYASSGISTSSGSALGVKLAEMREAEVDRLYQDDITNRRILGFFENETQRAEITLREAELGAAAAHANAEAEATVITNEARVAVNNARRNAAESGG